MNTKRGQITVFIIVGIIVVILIVIVIFISKPTAISGGLSISQVASIKNFVEKTEGFTGAGRGSAPSSVCLWLTDLTKIDPLKYNLIFERFANSARKDPPDIDIDFDSEHQKQIEGYLKDKYGVNKVCHVGNFSRFASKTIVKDLSRIFELNFDATNKLTKIFNDNIINSTIEKEIKNARKILEKLKDYKTVKFIDDNYELFVKIGSKFEGLARQLGKHASGIIISDKKLVDSDLPLQIIGGEIITGIQDSVDERGIAELGYMKLDILGLTTASVINNTFNLIEKKHNTKHMETEILTSDFNDAKVYDEFKEVSPLKDEIINKGVSDLKHSKNLHSYFFE